MIQIPSDATVAALPKPIAQALRRLIRRIREVILVRGISAVIATAAVSLLLIMAIDASVVLFSDITRWLLTLSAFALTLASAVWFLMLPLARTITLTGTARAIEDRHPELQERISSTVELLMSRDMPEIRGSQVLIDALAKEASRDAAHVRPRVEIPLKSARPFLLAALGALAVFAALLALYPNAQRLLARAVAPYLNLPNISADMLRVSPGTVRILEGQRLQVEVEVANQAVRKAQFRQLMPDGSEVAEGMTALLAPSDNDEPRFAIQCPGASESFRYRVHAGDALSRYFDVTVVPPPIVKRLEVRYDYPAYTQREPLVEPDSQGEIKAVAGTLVTVSAVTNKPVQSAELQITGQAVKGSPVQIAAGPDGPAVCTFQVKLTPRLRGRWALALKDEDGFSNTTGDRLIEAVPDTAPVVKILAPENKKLRLKPTDRLPIAYTMTDDFGLSAADFAIETDSRKRQNVPVTLTPPKDEVLRAAAGEASLNLASLPLAGARQFTFRLRAADNLPNDLRGPQQGYSETVTVDLDLSAASYAEQALAAEEEAIRKALEKILKELKKSKEDSVPLKELLPKIQAITEDAAKRIDRMRGHLGTAKGTVAELLPRVEEGTFAGLAPKMGSLATEVDGANDKSGQIKLVEATQERGTLATQTDVHIDRAIEIVLELLKQLGEMGDIARLAQSLQDLADRQEDLAAAKAEAELGAEQPPASPADWQKNESQVSKEVGNLVKEMAAARLAQLAQDQGRAKDLAAEARKLQAEQTALAQDTGKLGQIQQVDNALKNLAAEQAALAREASREKVAADQAKPMAAAADNIKAGALPQAVAQQKAAENALAERAQAGAQQAAGQQPSGQQQAGAQQPAGQQQAGAQQPAGQQQAGAQQPAAQQQPGGQQPAGQQPTGQQQASGQQPAGQQQAGAQQPAGQQQASAQQPSGQQQAGAQQPAGQQQAGGQQASKPPTPQEAARAGQLAAKQEDIRQRTEALLAQRNQAAGEIGQSQMSRLKQEQTQVAKEAAQLAQAAAPAGQEPAQLGQQAAGDAQDAADALPANIGEAAQHATQAGQELGALAQNLNKQVAQQAAAQRQKPAGQEAGGQEAGAKQAGQEAGGQEAGGQQAGGQQAGGQQAGGQQAGLAQQASTLAERQQELAREMQALAANQPQQALLAEQQAIQAQTQDLGQEVAALAERTQQMAPQLAGAAQQATGALGQAQQAEGQAGKALQSSAPQSATGPQQAAAAALGQAASALSSLGQALAQAASGAPAAQSPMGTPMANAFSAASQAAQSQTAASAASASQAMSAAASQAMGMAQGMGVQPGMGMMGMRPGQMPSQNANSKKGIGALGINLTAAKLESLGIKLSDWARLPGELRNQILQAAEEAGPEEYRTLIKRYFQQIAKRGGAESEGSTP
ncbi:MAG: DUF4175 family protein [Planctomycetota bacterium]|nr:DUF4175 family protein [Planctomycetota bacterium]